MPWVDPRTCEHAWWERFNHGPDPHVRAQPTGRICKKCNSHTYEPCPHPEEHWRARTSYAWEKDPLPACTWCAACGMVLSAHSSLDVRTVPGYNTEEPRENMNASGTHIKWRALTPDTVPPARTPVLLKLRVQPVPLARVGATATEDAEAAKRSLLERGTFYGYVTAVLAFELDGFGRPVPKRFQLLVLDGTAMSLGSFTLFADVEAWAVL